MKKNLVILHGWRSKSQSFKSILDYIDKNIKVILIDLPGFGNVPLERPYGLEDYLVYLEKFLEEKSITKNSEKFLILGHSFGGALALLYTLKNPDKIEKLILYNAAILRPESLKIRILNFLAKIFKPFEKLFPKKILFLIKKIFYKLIVGSYDYFLSDEILKETMKKIKKDLREEAKLVKNKTYLLWGKNDKITPLWQGKYLEKIMPKAKLIIVDGGHSFHKEKPEEFAKILNEIIND